MALITTVNYAVVQLEADRKVSLVSDAPADARNKLFSVRVSGNGVPPVPFGKPITKQQLYTLLAALEEQGYNVNVVAG